MVAAGTLAFLASAAVLVQEVLTVRLITPYVGSTLETYTAAIGTGTVLAGIAGGTWLGGKLADRAGANALLGPAAAMGGAFSLATLPLVHVVGPPLAGGGPFATVVLAVVISLAPVAALSTVVPAATKLCLGTIEHAGRVTGGVSALATAGALAGTVGAGVALARASPTRPVVLVVGVVLLTAGCITHLVVRMPGQLSGHARSLGAVLVVGLTAGAAAAATDGPCDVESAYYCVQVVDGLPPCTSGRTLYLDTLRHSCVHPGDPTRLDFGYTQVFGGVLAAVAPPEEPLDVLHIGGGAFTMPRYLAATRPGSRSTVLELDGALVDVARQEFGLVTEADLRVEVGDARTTLAQQPTDAYDVVIGDAFGGLAVPWHLTTAEVAEQVARVLRPAGVYTINVIDGPPLGFVRAEAATLRAVFGHVVALAPPEGLLGHEGGNFVLVGSDEPLAPDSLLAAGEARLAPTGQHDSRYTAVGGERLDAFIGDAQPLTDDYAPVDQLLTSPD